MTPYDAQHVFESVFAKAEQAVQKLWGVEYWLVNTPLYCSKILMLNRGFQCSFHMHPQKDETFIVLAGECELQVNEQLGHLVPGDTHRLPPNTFHKFWIPKDDPFNPFCIILEVSTQHSDDDVVRKEPSSELG